jgi:BRCA1-associated protein
MRPAPSVDSASTLRFVLAVWISLCGCVCVCVCVCVMSSRCVSSCLCLCLYVYVCLCDCVSVSVAIYVYQCLSFYSALPDSLLCCTPSECRRSAPHSSALQFHLLHSRPSSSSRLFSLLALSPQEGDESSCQRCDENRDLWICVVCGHMGCGRYMDGHAFEHYMETQHNYAMQVDTQRVWDYAGDNYVHRLVQNRSDGKVVRLDAEGGGEAGGGKVSDRKVNLLLAEYSSLLTTQLEAQRAFFEGELSKALSRVQANSEERIDQLSAQVTTLQQRTQQAESTAQRSVREARRLEQRLQQQQQRVIELEKENGFLHEVNKSLQENQDQWKQRLAEAKAQYGTDLQKKEAALEDLQDQVRDLSFFIEAGKAIEKAECADVADGGVVKVKDTSPAKPAAFRKPRQRRGRKR